MRLSKTSLFGGLTILLALTVFYFEYYQEQSTAKQKSEQARVLSFQADQINLIELQKNDQKVVVQKSEKGWTLIEPIQDIADNDQIEELIQTLADERMIVVAKESNGLTEQDLAEYGLNPPIAVYNFKNNSGSSKKISIGSQKNFEGNGFVRVDSENKVLVVTSVWHNKALNDLIFYREKRLFRKPLVEVKHVKIKSLQDQFELVRSDDNKWSAVGFGFDLDQNKVRDFLKKISETSIQEYVVDGDPSDVLIKEKGLNNSPIQIEMKTQDINWTVHMNQNEKDRTIYALTDRPTYLVKLDITGWEFFGNMKLDSLRDRTSLTRFNLSEVKKVYFKKDGKEMSFLKEQENWKALQETPANKKYIDYEVGKVLNRIHDIEISEFIDKKPDAFKGNNMVILKTDSDRLVYQLNWGPEFKISKGSTNKDYFYARTQAAQTIFALEKSKVESLGIDNIYEPLQQVEKK